MLDLFSVADDLMVIMSEWIGGGFFLSFPKSESRHSIHQFSSNRAIENERRK